MKGDFSRIRFERLKQYTAVLEQQGRVALDADANEQCAIDAYLRETETVDVVGRYGAPVHDAGYQITVQNNGLLIGAGRYYDDGLLCENPAAVSYDAQPFLLDATKSTALIQELIAGGTTATVRVFLQAWQRLVTALDDSCLREPALGQADTTARLQTVSRVVATLVEPRRAVLGGEVAVPGLQDRVLPTVTCCEAMAATVPPAHTGSMSAQTSGGTDACGCQPIPAAGYRGLENQLYRIEIQQSGDASTATFKWSRENGSVVTAIQSVSGADVKVSSLGRDANLGFLAGQWVEISDDTYVFGELPNQSGALYQIKQIDTASLVITMTTAVVAVDPRLNARLRRWDQSGPTAVVGGVALSAGWVDLENGIQVCFGSGDYVSGDYWTIPARTASGQIEWPPCGSDGQLFQGPHYAEIHTAPLACIHYVPPKTRRVAGTFTVEECRQLFWPLTELTPPAPPSALHVTNINWSNDDVMTLDVLSKNGLAISFDHAPTSLLSPANVVVTLETSFFPEEALTQLAVSADDLAGSLADARLVRENPVNGNVTYTILRQLTILDSALSVDAQTNVLTWAMPFTGSPLQTQEVRAIDEMLQIGARVGWPGRVRVRLFGSTMFTGTGSNRAFLDGQAFGQAAVRADGKTPRLDLQLPSGNDQKASDFESWFYLYPILQVSIVQATYTALTVRAVGATVVVTACTPSANPLPTAQQVTITLNYPALVATPVNLSLQGPAGIVKAPPSVTIGAGAISTQITLSLIGVPAAGTTATFTLTASVANAIDGPSSVSSQSFTISPAQKRD